MYCAFMKGAGLSHSEMQFPTGNKDTAGADTGLAMDC